MKPFDEVLHGEKPAFARAIRAIVTGDLSALRAELAAAPNLVRDRSDSPHRATLLHYVSANGVEDALQLPVRCADEIAGTLLAAGAAVDAACNAYEGRYPTTLSLVVSSDHPARAGVSAKLVHVLADAGAAVDGLAGDRLPLATSLLFGRIECFHALVARGARTDNLVFAAAAGDIAWVERWLARDPALTVSACPTFPLDDDRAVLAEQALVFASLAGRLDVVRVLLDHGTHIDATPPGSHWTATALHAAAGQGHKDIVELLVARGADQFIKDVRFQATPLDWAIDLHRDDVVAVLTELSI